MRLIRAGQRLRGPNAAADVSTLVKRAAIQYNYSQEYSSSSGDISVKFTIPAWILLAGVGVMMVAALLIDGLGTLFWVVTLGGLDALAVYFIMKVGLVHGDPIPEKPDDSAAVRTLRQANAERLARIEAARARAALPAGEAEPS